MNISEMCKQNYTKTTNKFDKTLAENRAESTKRLSKVKFANYEALCATN